MRIFEAVSEFLLSAFFPDRCSVCGEVVESGKCICDKCRFLVFPIESPVCTKCGASLEGHSEDRCREISAPVIGAYYYRDAVRNIIINFKDTKQLRFYRFLSLGLYEKIASEYSGVDFDIAVCVPTREKRKSTSGIICRETAKRFFIDFDVDVLEKYRETKKQHRLSVEERFTNLENSIRVRAGKESLVNGKTVLLCDDVKTTGTTLNECVKALYSAGAKEIYCACLAVSDYSSDKF